jgi:L-arabinose isomerase
MIDYQPLEAWFITGSQHLYGAEVLAEVNRNSAAIVDGFNRCVGLPVRVVFKPVLTTPEEIAAMLRDADAAPNCVGLIAWMHTFSPSRMWIGGLSRLRKPLCHLHTQFNRDIPWSTIDMDFMNLNQSAHGDREFGFICSRMRMERKVVVGHWHDRAVHGKLNVWLRAAAAWHDSQGMKIARFGDNMRQVAVTEGDKVEAELRFGYAVNGYGVGDLVERVRAVTESQVGELCAEYARSYRMMPALQNGRHESLHEAARIELGLRSFLEEGGFSGFTDTFENLHGLGQLPGLAVQRLMADGYGFGAEGDWKHAALVRSMKVMSQGLEGGTSFMEDYTYHLEGGRSLVLGSHMLEICPSIAKTQPRIEIHPLGIGGKDDPARLVFDAAPGEAVNASLVEFGDRFRLIVNEVKTIDTPHPMPKLPVAQAVWIPYPDFTTGLEGWLWAGGAHHTGYSTQITAEHLQVYADLVGLEFVRIGKGTTLEQVRTELAVQELLARLRSH